MPMYQYACDTCGLDFERAQSFHDDPLTECPECGGPVRRVIAPVGIIFKGSGWYITDSRRQIGTTARKGDKAEDNGSESEVKTAAKKKAVASGGTDSGAAPSPGNGSDGAGASAEQESSAGQESKAKSTTASPAGAKAGA
ncbi:MAG: FmdB family zinc ribbon protein [Anaerolineae bacterium]